MCKSLLAKEVLAEVPEQVTSYMKSKRIAPLEGNFSVNPDTSGGPSLNTAANYMPRIGQSSYPPSGPHLLQHHSNPQSVSTNNYYPNIGGPAVVDPGVLADGLRTNLHLHSSAPH
uniref:Uncharacterized protein n=1 Tax=Ditylenchus dipsaci TaxID=166011 RepID=A0A915DAY9_9BILA